MFYAKPHLALTIVYKNNDPISVVIKIIEVL